MSNFSHVRDIKPEYTLVQDSRNIDELLESIGVQADHDDYGCLFVKYGDAEVLEVYGCYQNVAYLACPVDKLK